MSDDKDYLGPGLGVLTPYICPRECARAIDWYVDVLGAVEQGQRYVEADGRVSHAQLDLDGAPLMLSDAFPDFGAAAPDEGSATATYALYLQVPDVDGMLARAAERGADVYRPAEDQPFGARLGAFFDPFGVRWMVATHRGG